jgi:DNA-binding transcriptional MerR regulator
MENMLPNVPSKQYFSIAEVADLCGVKPHVLRYWEQEFTQLHPMKRRGDHMDYQHHEVLMIRRIREFLYERGFSIAGVRSMLDELDPEKRGLTGGGIPVEIAASEMQHHPCSNLGQAVAAEADDLRQKLNYFRSELLEIHQLLVINV